MLMCGVCHSRRDESLRSSGTGATRAPNPQPGGVPTQRLEGPPPASCQVRHLSVASSECCLRAHLDCHWDLSSWTVFAKFLSRSIILFIFGPPSFASNISDISVQHGPSYPRKRRGRYLSLKHWEEASHLATHAVADWHLSWTLGT